MIFLDFEKPILELQEKLDSTIAIGQDTGVDIEDTKAKIEDIPEARLMRKSSLLDNFLSQKSKSGDRIIFTDKFSKVEYFSTDEGIFEVHQGHITAFTIFDLWEHKTFKSHGSLDYLVNLDRNSCHGLLTRAVGL
mgnify:CR=1 FL=1